MRRVLRIGAAKVGKLPRSGSKQVPRLGLRPRIRGQAKVYRLLLSLCVANDHGVTLITEWGPGQGYDSGREARRLSSRRPWRRAACPSPEFGCLLLQSRWAECNGAQ